MELSAKAIEDAVVEMGKLKQAETRISINPTEMKMNPKLYDLCTDAELLTLCTVGVEGLSEARRKELLALLRKGIK